MRVTAGRLPTRVIHPPPAPLLAALPLIVVLPVALALVARHQVHRVAPRGLSRPRRRPRPGMSREPPQRSRRAGGRWTPPGCASAGR